MVRLVHGQAEHIEELTFASVECFKHDQAKRTRRAGLLSMYMKPSKAEVTC